MGGYVKLFSSILDSTIWQEDIPTRLVWITMLATADKDGFVWSSIPGLANRARVSIENTKVALERFQQPDEYSRTTEDEGRRIRPIDGGWALINYDKYRYRLSPDDQRDRASLRQERFRARTGAKPTTDGYVYYAVSGERVKIGYSKNPWARIYEMKCFNPDANLAAYEAGTMANEKARHAEFSEYHIEREWFHLSGDLLVLVNSLRSPTVSYEPLRNDKQKQKQIAEADSKRIKSTARAHFALPSLGEVIAYCQERGNLIDPQKWFNHYTSNGWKVGRNSMKDWRAAIRTWEQNGLNQPAPELQKQTQGLRKGWLDK